MTTPRTKRAYTRPVKPMPPVVETPRHRGEAFAAWLYQNHVSMVDFVQLSGISLSTLSAYAQGHFDIAAMRQETAERFIPALGMTDAQAWAFFNVPDDQKKNFRTFRPPPVGSGIPRVSQSYMLAKPLLGVVTCPAGHVVEVDPDSTEGIVLVELSGYLLSVEAKEKGTDQKLLGKLLSVSLQEKARA